MNKKLTDNELEKVSGGSRSDAAPVCNDGCKFSYRTTKPGGKIAVINGIKRIECDSLLGIRCKSCPCHGTDFCIDTMHTFAETGRG